MSEVTRFDEAAMYTLFQHAMGKRPDPAALRMFLFDDPIDRVTDMPASAAEGISEYEKEAMF